MDNATNNDTALRSLSELLSTEREFLYDAQEHRIRCFPHIINLCVQRTLSNYTQANFSNTPSSWSNNSGERVRRDEYIDAMQGDPVNLARTFVNAVRVSGQRREAFRQTIKNGNNAEVFTDPNGNPIQLPNRELLLDVRTRWDSTYKMINCIRGLRQVCDLFSNGFC